MSTDLSAPLDDSSGEQTPLDPPMDPMPTDPTPTDPTPTDPGPISTRPIGAAEALAETIGRLGVTTEPDDVKDYLALITATSEMEAQARTMLHEAVAAARSAGATWTSIGATLQMSKQAAQKRFVVRAAPSSSGLDPHERILGPVTAFNELAELALAGRYGWHSVEFGPYFHRVVHSDTQWEHTRVSMLRTKARAMAEQGWQVIGSEFPFTYLKRDLGTPALTEPTAVRTVVPKDLPSPE